MANIVELMLNENETDKETPEKTEKEILLARKEKRKAYMRAYKKKKYNSNDKIKKDNKIYYYKYKYNMSDSDVKKFKSHTPLVARLRKSLAELYEATDKEFMKGVLAEYI